MVLLSGCLLMLSAPTCEDNNSVGGELLSEMEELQSLTADFTAGSLTRANLEAFENKAVQKLKDYSDYLNIVHNPEIDETFRSRASESLRDLFEQRSIPENPVPGCTENQPYSYVGFIIDSVGITDPLEYQSEGSYRGRMQYYFSISGYTGSDTVNLYSSFEEMSMHLQMIKKDFGNDSVVVWEVLLASQR